jgi:HPt (histidine-containing phosphotransfer) domain-containing protein
MPVRLDELRAAAAGFRAGHPDATGALKVRLHRLTGSAGSYGFQDLSSIAREAELWLARFPTPGDADQLEAMVDRMAKAVEEVAGRRGGGAAE